MRRTRALLLFSGFALVAFALLSSLAWGYSDGVSGSTGQVPVRLRTCEPGFEYCAYEPAYCGGCHGEYRDMREQEGAKPTPQDRVNGVEFVINGDAKGGQSGGEVWEYQVGQSFVIDIQLPDDRPAGPYNAGGFDLSGSAGRLDKANPNDDTVRITGGNFDHAGSKNTTYNVAACGKPECRIGPVEESATAGEATHTARGAEQRAWRLKWTAPDAEAPHGVALVLSVMLPNGDGLRNCTRSDCDSSQPFTPQSTWDWYGTMIPRRILCERGAYADFRSCQSAVLDFVLPPGRPRATDASCEPGSPGCPASTDGRGGTPVPVGLTFVALFAAAGWWSRHH